MPKPEVQLPQVKVEEVKVEEVKVEEVKVESEPKIPENIGAEQINVKSDGSIEVVALRRGMFRLSRKEAGDKFRVPAMKNLGTWMKCVDAKVQQEHVKNMKAKKKKFRAGL